MSVCQNEMPVLSGPLEGPATLDLTPQDFLCNSLGWGGTAFGRDNMLRDSMTKALMFPLLAFKDEQQDREANVRVFFSDMTYFCFSPY